MPIGSYALVELIVDDFVKAQPKRILDAGIGMGFYGATVRQWLDSGYRFKTELIGVEGFGEYRNPCWDLYDSIYVGDLRAYLQSILPPFDYIIFSDVLEHFGHTEGELVISSLVRALSPSGILMIGTPGVFCQQGAVYGNEFERHESIWEVKELTDLAERLNCEATVLRNEEPDKFGHYMILVKFKKLY